MTGFYDCDSFPEPPTSLRQGDILRRVPFFTTDLADATLVEDAEVRHVSFLDDTLDDCQSPLDFLVSTEVSLGIVLSQSCDLVPGRSSNACPKPIVIARVTPIAERVTDFARPMTLKQRLGAIRTLANPGKTPSLFYLPPSRSDDDHGGFPRAVASLLEVSYVPQSSLASCLALVCARLSPPAVTALQERCAYCFGRFGSPDTLFLTEQEASAPAQ